MGCTFLFVMGLWLLFGVWGMWNAAIMIGMPEWAAILVIVLMLAVTWLLGDDR